MPSGYLLSFLTDEDVVVSLSQYPQQIVLSDSNFPIMRLVKHSDGLRIQSPSSGHQKRSLHIEVAGEALKQSAGQAIFYAIRFYGREIKVGLSVGDENAEAAAIVHPQNVLPMNRTGPPMPLASDIVFAGETFHVRCMFAPNGRVSQITLNRKATDETRVINLFGNLGMQRVMSYKVKCFPGVSPAVFLVVMQVLHANRPTAFDQLAL